MDWRRQKIIDNLWGPGGTVVFHVLLLVLLINVVHFKARTTERGVEAVIHEIQEMEDIEEIEQELEEIEEIPTVVDVVAPPSVSLDSEPPQVDTMKAPGSEAVDLTDFNVVDSVSPLTFKGLYSSRSAGGRANGLRKYAGGLEKRTEFAVMKALHWLKDHQYPDGSWGPQYRAAMTGLALLAFFAHGETTASPVFGMAIRKGLQSMLKRQKDGVFVGGGPVDFWSYPTKYVEQVRSYEHAIATYALAEAYNLTKIPYLKKPMEDAVQVIIDGQNEAGSWDYGYTHGPESQVDVSLAGWHVQALKAAAAANAENPGLKSAIEAGVRGMYLQYRKTKKFQYSTRDEEHEEDVIMTGVAVLCLQLVGHALDDEASDAMVTLHSARFVWDPGKEKGVDKRGMKQWPYYSWYYITQARFHHGGRTWLSWNKQFAPVLCDMQNPDGSWCPAPKTREGMFGPVYHTALAALQLEVYYRFLPTYQPIKVDEGPALDEVADEDDIVIKFG